MDEKSIIAVAVKRILGTAIRHGLTSLGLWLFTYVHVNFTAGTIDNLSALLEGLAVLVVSFALSWYKDRKAHEVKKELVEMKVDAGIIPPPSVKAEPASFNSIIGPLIVAAFIAGASLGCSTISAFDQNTYTSATELRATSVWLIGHALEPSTHYKSEIADLRGRLSAALAYEKGKGKTNATSAKQWEIVVSPDHFLLGGMLKAWEAKGDSPDFSPAFVEEKVKQIADGFDEILRLEASKRR